MKAISLFCLLTLLFAGTANRVFAQNPSPAPTDAASARQLIFEAMTLIDSNQFDQGLEQAERAYQFFKTRKDGQTVDLAESAYWVGRTEHARKNYTRARSFLSESLDTWMIAQPNGALGEAKTRLALGNALQQSENAEAAIEQGQKTIILLDRLKIENDPLRFGALRVIGRSLYGTGQYNKAIPFYEEALKLAHDYYGEDNTEMAMMMIYLGNCLNYCGFLERAIAILERGLAIQQQKLPLVHEQTAGTYMALGACHQALKKYDSALEYYAKAVEMRLKLQSPRLAYGYSKIGQIYLENHDYDQALDYFQKGNEVLIQHKLERDPAYAYGCRDFGLACYGLKDYDKAIHWYNKALVIFQGTDNGSMGLDECYVVFDIGRAQTASGAYEAALQSFAESQKIMVRLFGPGYPLLYESNAEIADTYTQLYLKTGQDSFLVHSRAYFGLAMQGMEQQLQNETYEGSEKKLLFEALPYFERAMGTELLFLKSKPGDEAAIEKAWQLSEAMHAQLLLSAVQESNARHFAGIPDAELLRDSVLQSQITLLTKEREALASKGRPLTDSLVLSINAKIYLKKDALKALRASFEKNYPNYFQLRYDLRTSSLAKTQKALAPHQTLLEYFTGDSSIFLFVVQQNGSRVVEIKRDFPLSDWVQALREGISGYHTALQKTPALYEKTVLQYADVAQKLYKKLLAPVAGFLTPEIIIVPGDGLASLPFEALLSATPKDLSNFTTYPFLLRSHSFQYAYSATMLHEMTARQHRQSPTGTLLAFAPFFEEDTASLAMRLLRGNAFRLGFSPLPFSGEEVVRAKNRCGGASEVLTSTEATKQKFQEMAAQYQMLHLATHGKANNRDGDFSFLAFSSNDEKPENSLLSVGELYNLPINADLVVLSACETGIGEQQRGEGVVSLARAFAFAGAKCIVASLWSVNDKSTMLVMDHFYQGIKSGKPKNIALANAKLQYLKHNPAQKAHPFFWAGFVAVGDMSAIKN